MTTRYQQRDIEAKQRATNVRNSVKVGATYTFIASGRGKRTVTVDTIAEKGFTGFNQYGFWEVFPYNEVFKLTQI